MHCFKHLVDSDMFAGDLLWKPIFNERVFYRRPKQWLIFKGGRYVER